MRLSVGITAAVSVLFYTASARADQAQLQALLAMYFLRNHQAVPLHSNGDVKSGDVLHMPDEGTFLSRKDCYKLPPPRYRNLDAEFIQTTNEIAGEVGGTLPVEKIVKIEADIGGKLRQIQSIVLDPFEEEQPPGGYSVLLQPNPDAQCDIIRDILAGKTKEYILATRVFHGIKNALASLDVSGQGKINADIEKIIKALLGAPRVSLKGSGGNVTLEYSESPDEHSLAVQSAVINPDQLARIYLKYRTENGFQLERRVYEYLTGSDPGLLETVKMAIKELLSVMEIRPVSPASLYAQVFGGEGSVRSSEAKVPQEQWNAFATVAAALEIMDTTMEK